MDNDNNIAMREAQQGERMIEIKVRFWTNDLAPKGSVRQKHAWTSGVVRMQASKAHGIQPKRPKTFNSLLDLGTAIERTLKEHNIVLHISRSMEKYVVSARET